MRKARLLILPAVLILGVMFATPLPTAPAPRPVAAEPEPTWRDGAVRALRVEHLFSGVCGSAAPLSCRPSTEGFDVILLTCKHVVEKMEGGVCAVFDLNDRMLGYAEVLKSHVEHDAALMRLHSPQPVEVVEVRDSPLLVAEDVWAAGYPGGERLVITHGVVGNRGGASAAAFPGNSGGPVVDCRGRLVGIVARIRVSRTFGAVCHDMRFETFEDLKAWIEPYL